MRSLRRFLKRLMSWSTTQRDEDRLRQEIEEHLALQTAENVRSGLAPAEARRQAILKFGAIQAVRESYRDQRGLPRLETLLLDTRHALRSLRKAPAFTITIILTLALGIGATTSIFTLVHAVLLKSLPVAKPDELYRLGKDSNCCYHGGYSFDQEFSLVSYDLYKYLRDNTGGFSELAAFPAFGPIFGVRRARGSEAIQIDRGEFVSGNYFAMFGIGAYTGRMLTPLDDREGAPPVAVMSYRLWEQSYGSDPLVLGSVFQLNEKPFTVVGIAPPGFFGDTLRSAPPDFFLPLNTEPYIQTDSDLKYSSSENWDVIPAAKRDNRETLVHAANAYLDAFLEGKKDMVPWGYPCNRTEGGMHTGKGVAEDSCDVGVPSGVNIANRHFVVDETIGAVVAFCTFGAGNATGGSGAPDTHLFRVENGKLRFVHTLTHLLQANGPGRGTQGKNAPAAPNNQK